MSMRLTRDAYAKLVAEDVEWLQKQPRTLEREHILLILAHAVDYEYGRGRHPLDEERRCEYCGKMTRITTAGCDHCDVEDK